MIKTITANTQFQVPCVRFSIYAAESAQMSISADGTHFTNFGDAFSGTKVFKDNPINLFIKFDKDITLAY